MALTLTNCRDMIRHTLDGELPPEIAVLDIVNRAGSWLYTCHAWSWLTRSASVTATVAQNYVPLSSLALTQVENVYFQSNLSRLARETTLEHINRIRTSSLVNTIPSYWALGWRDISLVQTRVLEFDWAFSTADVLTVLYRSDWSTPTGNVQVPQAWEGMFLQAIRSYARGYQEEDTVPLDQRMQALQASGEMMNLKRLDGMAQASRGAARGGIGSMPERIIWPQTLGGY